MTKNSKETRLVVIILVAILLLVIQIGEFIKLQKLQNTTKECSNRIDVLEQKNTTQSDEEEVDKAEVDETEGNDDVNGNDETIYETDEAFLSKLFPTDGALYKPKRNDVFFYSDVKCTKRIKNVKLISINSWRSDAVSLYYDGETTYAYRMSNKKICYSKQKLCVRDCVKCN